MFVRAARDPVSTSTRFNRASNRVASILNFYSNRESIMPVNPKTVKGRRDLSFQTFHDVVADVEQLVAARNCRMLGNWSLPVLINHLTMTMNSSIDGFALKAPFLIRFIGPLIKRSVVYGKKLSPGIKLPANAVQAAFPCGNSAHEALADLKASFSRALTERMEADHPAFGKMTHEEWLLMQLRHAEMHLSFALPE